MSMLKDREAAVSAWSQFLDDWEEMEDEDPKAWRKITRLAVFFITKDEYDGGFDFTIQDGDGDVIIEDQRLDATDIDEAIEESEGLIADFVAIGASTIKMNEIRIRQALVLGNSILAVGEDGVLYHFNGSGWEPRPMALEGAV